MHLDGDRVTLINPSNKIIASCEKLGNGKVIILKGSAAMSSSSSSSTSKPNADTQEAAPLIEDIDLLDERIVIKNPSSEIRDLSGWKVSDNEGKNVFVLLEGTVISPKGCLHVYCSSKRGEGADDLKEPNIFWRNKDGSLRMKNVLNDGKDILS